MSQETPMSEESPRLEFAFEARVSLGPSEHVGNGAGDVLDFTPITGGSVDGPRLRGTVVPGGGDWSVRRGATMFELDARYLIRAEDGALVDIANHGYYRTATAEAMERVEAGEDLDPSQVYFGPRPSSAPTLRSIAGLPRPCSSAWPVTRRGRSARFYEVL